MIEVLPKFTPIQNPSPELLITVLRDPKIQEIQITNGIVSFTHPNESSETTWVADLAYAINHNRQEMFYPCGLVIAGLRFGHKYGYYYPGRDTRDDDVAKFDKETLTLSEDAKFKHLNYMFPEDFIAEGSDNLATLAFAYFTRPGGHLDTVLNAGYRISGFVLGLASHRLESSGNTAGISYRTDPSSELRPWARSDVYHGFGGRHKLRIEALASWWDELQAKTIS